MDYQELIDDLRCRINTQYVDCMGTESYERKQCLDAIESLLAENERLKLLEESALKVCSELDNIVMVMPYDYLDPPDGGNVPMSEQISRMWSEVKELRAELKKFKEVPHG